jgi:hypothetical protein
MQYDVNVKLMLDTKQAALKTFVNSVKGRTSAVPDERPIRLPDQLDAGGALRDHLRGVALHLYDITGFMVRADTTTIGSLFSDAQRLRSSLGTAVLVTSRTPAFSP